MKALILDLFGTLIDLESDKKAHEELSKFLAKLHGNVFSWEEHLRLYNKFTKEPKKLSSTEAAWEALIKVLGKYGLSPKLGKEELVKAHGEFHARYAIPAHGLNEVINEARKLGLKLGLVTDAERYVTYVVLKSLGLTDVFDVIITKDDVGTRKPDPKMFINALNALGVNGDEALMVGDSCNDVKGAHGAGMEAVLIGFKECDENPDYVINSLIEVINIIKRKVSKR